MSELQKEIDEYITRYANHNKITKEEAITHAMVKCYEKYKKEGYEIEPMIMAGIEVVDDGRNI